MLVFEQIYSFKQTIVKKLFPVTVSVNRRSYKKYPY